ncbi:MAG TPA: 4Fe-4S ferredoxin [Chitinophagaceae bacterium]|nr:4Fe-4S ferredoxin [Chitinophagaceae bacterium]
MSLAHANNAAKFIANEERTNWHDDTLWFIRSKRDNAAASLPEWEQLREIASTIKAHTLDHLETYLIEFEANATKNGVQIHWANDALEHNAIVLNILNATNIKQMVKSKSMLTEECHLNQYLQANGIQVVDTDLGERIVQLRNEIPSHIVLPAIHLKKQDVSETFHQHLQSQKDNNDPTYLTRVAREHLREHFFASKVALTGVNFAVASTGSIVVCTNEGNADLGVHTADIHIASMGIEKLIPKPEHLSTFLRLLARSATGQPITTYSSHFTKPQAGKQMHVIIVNNKRTEQLAQDDFRSSLKCIRCAACFNTCPVYRRSGGHSYHTAIAGPIGSILSPNIDMKANADLPFASTLCGSCTNVCPVKIDIHNQLWKWRQRIVQEGYDATSKKVAMKGMSVVLGNPKWYRLTGKLGRWMIKYFPSLANNPYLNVWAKQRNMPKVPDASFREWYIKNRKKV